MWIENFSRQKYDMINYDSINLILQVVLIRLMKQNRNETKKNKTQLPSTCYVFSK